jgi:hypothetical protein
VSSLLALLVACAGGDGSDKDTGAGADRVDLPVDCSALPAANGTTLTLGPDDDVAAAVRDAAAGTTLLLRDGTYDLSGGDATDNLAITADQVTIRSASGNPDAVVLDARYATTELVSITGRDATIAEVTLQRSYGDAIGVHGASGARVYRVHVVDPGGSAVLARADAGSYADSGEVACATFERTTDDPCATGVEALQAEGWVVRDSVVTQGACGEPGIRFWTGSKDTIIERNRVSGGNVGIAVGDVDYGEGDERDYGGDLCPDLGSAGHYGGIVRNNFVWGMSYAGIRAEDTCATTLAQNSVAGGNGIDWRSSDDLALWNNLATRIGSGDVAGDGNADPTATDFVDAGAGDLHLAAGSGAVGAGAVLDAGLADDDIDRDARDEHPDIGADEAR